jgi:galactonate dehydratase
VKITKLELFKVPPRWLFLKIETDEGITGWGEPVVEGKADTVAAAVMEMSDQIIGKDPMRIEDMFQVLYRGGFYRGGPILSSAISGIEQALWDIKGKFYNAPVYDLLGGACRDRTRVYSWIGGDRPSDVGQAAKQQVQAGFTAVKMNATEELHYIDSIRKVDEAIARIAAVREAVGKDVGIGIDFHGRVHKSMAKIIVKELEPYRPMFIEEPVLPENNEALKEIARYTSCPIATGERMYTRWGFKELLAQGIVDIIQPDLSHAGGILETQQNCRNGRSV